MKIEELNVGDIIIWQFIGSLNVSRIDEIQLESKRLLINHLYRQSGEITIINHFLSENFINSSTSNILSIESPGTTLDDIKLKFPEEFI